MRLAVSFTDLAPVPSPPNQQEVPWQDTPLVYYKKFRIYFQPFNASHHKQIERHDWGIAADGDRSEYDVKRSEPRRY